MGWRKVERKIIQNNTDKIWQIETTKLVAELNPNTWIIKIIMLNSSVFRIVKEIKYNYYCWQEISLKLKATEMRLEKIGENYTRKILCQILLLWQTHRFEDKKHDWIRKDHHINKDSIYHEDT